MNEGPYRDDEPKPTPKRFVVNVTVKILDVATMVRNHLIANGWDPRKLPAENELRITTTQDGCIQVVYQLDGAP